MGHSAFIGFGSNIGDRKLQFDRVLKALAELPDTVVVQSSGLYETEPKDLSDGGGEFLNAVVEVRTGLGHQELMDRLRTIERGLGKSVSHRSDLSRQVDLDLLLYGELHFESPDLEIPHPRMHDRAFVLVPLAEIAPTVVHPGLGRTMADLLGQIPEDELRGVRRVGDGRPRLGEA